MKWSFIIVIIVAIYLIVLVIKKVSEFVDEKRTIHEKKRKDKEWKRQCEEFRQRYGPRN